MELTFRAISPPLGLRAERDKLAGDNDELQSRVDKLQAQLSDLTTELVRNLDTLTPITSISNMVLTDRAKPRAIETMLSVA